MEVKIPRFNWTQRATHWIHSFSFLILAGTGLSLYLPFLASVVGNRLLLREIHIFAAIIYLFGPILAARFGNWVSIKADIRETDLWEPADFQWLRRLGRKSNQMLETGRFNAGQKLNGIFTVVAGLLFAITGTFMWQSPRFPGWLVENSIFLHDWLTWLAVVAWAGHVYFSVLHPSTRESLRGMTLGWVEGRWAKEHHKKWYTEKMKRLKVGVEQEK